MRAVLAVVLVIATATAAAAQAPGETSPQTPAFEEKSPASAMALTAGGALAGLAIARADPTGIGIVGIVMGPSVGRWYGHEFGALGMAARLGATILVLDALGDIDLGGCESDYTPAECQAVHDREQRGERKLYLGLALYGASSLYDLIQSGFGAERYNEAQQRRLQIAPALVGRNTVGLGVGFRF